jgi:hypothetical protein
MQSCRSRSFSWQTIERPTVSACSLGDVILGAYLIAAKASTCTKKSGFDNCDLETVLLSGDEPK